MTYNLIKDAFLGNILVAYIHGEDNAFEAYQRVYGNPREDESDIEYVLRCAEQDFDNAQYQGAVYQDVYDALWQWRSSMTRLFEFNVQIQVEADSLLEAWNKLDKVLYYNSQHKNEFSPIKTYFIDPDGDEITSEEEEHEQ